MKPQPTLAGGWSAAGGLSEPGEPGESGAPGTSPSCAVELTAPPARPAETRSAGCGSRRYDSMPWSRDDGWILTRMAFPFAQHGAHRVGRTLQHASATAPACRDHRHGLHRTKDPGQAGPSGQRWPDRSPRCGTARSLYAAGGRSMREGAPMTEFLVETKLLVPGPRRELVARPRLVETIERAS